VTIPHRAAYGQLFAAQASQQQTQDQVLNQTHNQVSHRDPPLVYENLIDGTDLKTLSDGKVSLTPLNLDLVAQSSIPQLSALLRNQK
jgi:hypothetical protein